MVKLGKLWGDAKFASLSPLSKLIYSYLTTQPNITTLGVLVLDLNRVVLDLKLSMNEVQGNLRSIKDHGYIGFFYSDHYVVTIIVLDHYKSLAKSKANMRKGLDEGQSSKGKIREILLDIFTKEDFQGDEFVPPTPKEVSGYAMTLGFTVNGRQFVEYYGNNDWYNKNDKKVRNWKATVRNVWCRDTNKLEKVEGAPKGFEYFFVEIEEGNRIYPQSWKNDLPSHSNYIHAQYLIDGFNEQKNS